LFGGAIRDLALTRPHHFRSDLDLVVNTDDESALDHLLNSFGARRNRHGGFRLRIEKWRFDVWSLSSTWAIRHGYVEAAKGFEVLPATTFFTWDAVAYGVDTGILYGRSDLTDTDDYLTELLGGVLEVNLEPNPNPVGNVIRALRFVHERRARELSERLTSYAFRTLADSLGESEWMREGIASRRILAGSLSMPPENIDMVGTFLTMASKNSQSRFRFPGTQYHLGL
jgi:hypothetical protein